MKYNGSIRQSGIYAMSIANKFLGLLRQSNLSWVVLSHLNVANFEAPSISTEFELETIE